jgi:ubiquinone/menaquinone biosynthesis C-methylase UbiE
MIKFPESKLAHKYLDSLQGIEIGGSYHNQFGLKTWNVDLYTSSIFKDEERKMCGNALRVDIVAAGDVLPVRDASLDFVISSHVIEHFYDPIKTLREWFRTIKTGGYLFTIVPHKDRTFDSPRPRTTLQELIARQGQYPVIEQDHHSVWVTQDFVELCQHLQFNVIAVQDTDDKVGNGFTVVIKK